MHPEMGPDLQAWQHAYLSKSGIPEVNEAYDVGNHFKLARADMLL